MLPVLLSAMFMAQFDLYVVNVAAPSLERDLDAGQAALELIVAGYAFTYASGLITGGRLGDLFGSRRLFLWGTVAFTGASLLCGLAQTPGQLVAARLLQGLTGAAMVPQVLALITAVFPGGERPRALSWFGVTMGVGAVAGQVLGGALLEWDLFGLGWRVIFLVNVPVGLAAVGFALRLLPVTRSAARPKLDPLGALGISGALALALVPLVLGRTEGWPVWAWVSLGAAAPVMALALWWERALAARGGQPLLDLRLFHDRAFNRGLVVNIGAFASFHSFMFTLTLVLQSGIGLSPLDAGWTFCPLGLAFATASVSAQKAIARHGAKVITVGTLIAAAGVLSLLGVLWGSGSHTSALRLIGPMVLVGTGNGLAVPALVGAVLAGVRSGQAGAAAGVLTTAQQFASAAGIAALGSVFFAVLGSGGARIDYVHGLEWVAAIDLVLVLAAAAISTLLPRP
ncbi:MFS transporter, partial [Wenjunlia tyrosinilytica]|uniref:MFS transporter n=1 Tax=Wenjunlia tyrosinilytica TaxID=1544741 RepID=UPI003570B956